MKNPSGQRLSGGVLVCFGAVLPVHLFQSFVQVDCKGEAGLPGGFDLLGCGQGILGVLPDGIVEAEPGFSFCQEGRSDPCRKIRWEYPGDCCDCGARLRPVPESGSEGPVP